MAWHPDGVRFDRRFASERGRGIQSGRVSRDGIPVTDCAGDGKHFPSVNASRLEHLPPEWYKELDSCGGVVGREGATPAPPAVF
jgi:hypothetical protein